MRTVEPPQIHYAVAQLKAALQEVERRDIDVDAASWADLEKSVVKLLGGPLRMELPEHQAVVMGLAGLFGRRLAKELSAFWVPNRESADGLVMGFPDALVMLSPFGAAADALSHAHLPELDSVMQRVSRSIAQTRFSPQGGAAGAERLTPELYRRLFDPGFIQFVLLDVGKARAAWEGPLEGAIRQLREALGQSSRELPPEVRRQLEGQLLPPLERLDVKRPLIDQAAGSGRAAELVGHLFGTMDASGAAQEELWSELALPLLFIGAPAQSPPLGEEERQAVTEGADPLLLFLDVVPFSTPAPEEGLLGAFPVEEVELPHPKLAASGSARLLQVGRARIAPLLARFDPAQARQAIARFAEHVKAQLGVAPRSTPEGDQMLDAALHLLSDLARLCRAAGEGRELCLRRLTEAEAVSEGALAVLREAIQKPRIILTV